MLPGRLPLALALGHQQQLARAATLEQLRERLETGMGAGAVTPGAAALEGPERKMARLAEEQQRLLQQAFQQNLLAMASQVNPASLRMNSANTRGECGERREPWDVKSTVKRVLTLVGFCFFLEEKQDLSLSISSNGSASITVSVEVNGIIYSGVYLCCKALNPRNIIPPRCTNLFQYQALKSVVKALFFFLYRILIRPKIIRRHPHLCRRHAHRPHLHPQPRHPLIILLLFLEGS